MKPEDYWGGLVFDEMKIQEDLQMKVRDGKHHLVGLVELKQFYDDAKVIETGIYCGEYKSRLLDI